MKLNNILLPVFILGMVGGAVYLSYSYQKLPDSGQAEQRSAEVLLQLQGDEAQVNEALLRARDNIDTNYDNLTKLSATLRDAADAAVTLAESSANPQAQQGAAQVKAAVANKLELVERFKSHNSVLKNAIRYAPQVAATLAGIAEKNGLDALAIRYLDAANTLQMYGITQNPALKQNIERTFATLKREDSIMPVTSLKDQIEFTLHGRTMLAETEQVNDLINSALQPLSQPFTTLQEGFMQWQKHIQQQVAQHNRYLMIYIAYLIIGLIFTMWWLARLYRTLDRRIAERTDELQSTYQELTRSQLMLMQSEKMATLGQMVAGVTHEVNTPLGYVKNNIDLIKELFGQYNYLLEPALKLNALQQDHQGSKEEKRDLLNAILSEAAQIDADGLQEEQSQLFADTSFGIEQISELVVNLRNFARLDEEKIKRVNIVDCIESSMNIARNNIKHFTLEKRYSGKQLPEIECSPSQINQVLLNLFNNAAQAMNRENGRLIIDADAVGDSIEIKVGDNGSGMAPETLKKIFEPFFTTKGAGEGTGLGLAICKQIIDAHNGAIEVRSQQGKGTIFTIRLPINPNIKPQPNQ